MTDTPRIINGCPVIWEQDGMSIIEHPNAGFMVYSNGPRVGIYKTLKGAIARAERQPKLSKSQQQKSDIERAREYAESMGATLRPPNGTGSFVPYFPTVAQAAQYGVGRPGAHPDDQFTIKVNQHGHYVVLTHDGFTGRAL